jgi:hypothetical protein
VATTTSSISTPTNPQLFEEPVGQTTWVAPASTTPSLLHWQISRFDILGTSPSVVICARGHLSLKDALELKNLPSLSAFWERALSARLFHRVDSEFFTGCMSDIGLWGACVNVNRRCSNRVVVGAHTPWRQGHACSHANPLSIYWDSGE